MPSGITFETLIREQFPGLFEDSDEVLVTKHWLKKFFYASQRAYFATRERSPYLPAIAPQNLQDLVFDVTQIAAMVSVSRSKVISWIGRDLLKAYQLPNRKYQVTRENLVAFLKKYDIPAWKQLAYADEIDPPLGQKIEEESPPPQSIA